MNAKTTAALEQDGSLRCLLEIKYRHRDRHSVPFIAWATWKAKEISRGLLKGAGQEAEEFTGVLNQVLLGKYHHPSYICYDLYLEKCSSQTRKNIGESTRQPIHVITKNGGVFIARRDPRLDPIVAQCYEFAQEHDKGPRPYFADSEHPPLYILGRRVEEPWVGTKRETRRAMSMMMVRKTWKMTWRRKTSSMSRGRNTLLSRKKPRLRARKMLLGLNQEQEWHAQEFTGRNEHDGFGKAVQYHSLITTHNGYCCRA